MALPGQLRFRYSLRGAGSRATIAERALRPGVVTAPRRDARRLVARRRADAGHGRRPRHRSRLGRLVPRHLGDDDGGDDAAVGDADGAAVLEGASGVDAAARPRDGAVRDRLPGRVDGLRARRLRAVPARARGRPVVPRLGQGRSGGRRRGDRARGRLPADTVQARVPAPLPHAAELRHAPLARRLRSAPCGWASSTAPGASAAAGR